MTTPRVHEVPHRVEPAAPDSFAADGSIEEQHLTPDRALTSGKCAIMQGWAYSRTLRRSTSIRRLWSLRAHSRSSVAEEGS